MMPTPPPMMHGDSDDAGDAVNTDRQRSTDRADEADPPLFHDVNAEAYRNADAASAAALREADPGRDADTDARGGNRSDDSLPFDDNPAIIALAGAGAGSTSGAGTATGPSAGVAAAQLATGDNLVDPDANTDRESGRWA